MTLTLEEALELHGVDRWEGLTPSREKLSLDSPQSLIREHSKEWVFDHRERLKVELRMVFDMFMI